MGRVRNRIQDKRHKNKTGGSSSKSSGNTPVSIINKEKASTKSYTFYLDFSDDFVVKNITKKSGGYYKTTVDRFGPQTLCNKLNDGSFHLNHPGTCAETGQIDGLDTSASMGSFTSDLFDFGTQIQNYEYPQNIKLLCFKGKPRSINKLTVTYVRRG